MAKRINNEAVRADVEAQAVQHGRADYINGKNDCPFSPTSLAAQAWRKGFEEEKAGPGSPEAVALNRSLPDARAEG